MHIHIRTSVPGIEKVFPRLFLRPLCILSLVFSLFVPPRESTAHAHSRIYREKYVVEEKGEGQLVAPREKGRRNEREGEEQKGMDGSKGLRIDERFEKRSGKIP